MKKYNIKTMEKFKLNAVGEDASVRLRKNQNRNNIITFDKHKSNVVGVGVPDDPKKIHIKLTTYGEIIEKQIKDINKIYNDIRIENYIIMPNHVHMIIELTRQENGSSRTPTPTNAKIPIIVSTLKRLTNKEIENKIWQRNYYEHIIRNEKEYYEIIKYMQNNPIRWIQGE